MTFNSLSFNFFNTPGFINDKCEPDSDLWRESPQTQPTGKLNLGNLDKLLFEARFEDEITEADDIIVYIKKVNYPINQAINNIELQLPYL
jgi:hypothetical protein